MRRNWFIAIVLMLPPVVCLVPPPLYSADPSTAEPVDLPAFRGADGKAFNPFAQLTTRAVVVAFLSFDCPVARDYVEPLSKLAKEYAPKGVTVIGLVPGVETAEAAKQAAEFKVGFPVFADFKLTAVGALKAGHTPEVFVLDAGRVVRYRGRIDNKYGARLKANPSITRHDLRDALDAVLSGKAVEVPVTPPVGCEIFRPKSEKPAGSVTYSKDVLPILQNRCQECHRPGEAGPFSLMTYKQAVNWAHDIKTYTRSRQMPPWKPTDGVGFQHDRRMTEREIETLAAWADGGTPEGDPKDAPPSKVFTKGWSLGQPDLVLTVDEDFHLGATGPDHYRCFVLPTGLTEDKHVVAYEVRPGNASVVHHSVNFYDTTGTARRLDREARAAGSKGPDRGPGYESPMGIGFTPDDPSKIGGLGGWTPGMRGVPSPAGTARLLPKGSDAVLQLHYHRSGKPETDRTSIGLYFAKPGIDLKRLQVLVVPGLVSPADDFHPFETIPAGAVKYKVIGKVVVEDGCTAYTVLPHMHIFGTRYRLTMTPPGGRERTIVAIDEWDFNWQEVYTFKQPMPVPAGTVFTVEAEYNNSRTNPNNPFAPPREVKKGEGTHDEMLFAFLAATTEGNAPLKVRPLMAKAAYLPK